MQDTHRTDAESKGSATDRGKMKAVGTVSILKNDQVTFHSYLSPEDGEMVCSQVIETGNKLVVVDALLLRPYARELRRYVDSLNKPIDRVIITHSHPDHWFGLEFFDDVPIYSLQETIDEIEEVGDTYLEYKRPQHGDLIATSKIVPSKTISEGIENIDGLNYAFTKVTDAEASLMLLIELPDLKTLVAQDLLYNGVYLYTGEKNSEGEYCFDGWTRILKSLQEKEYDTILVGHGEPADPTIFAEMIDYIEYAKRTFESVSNGDELKAKLIEKCPTFRVVEMLDISNVFLYDLF